MKTRKKSSPKKRTKIRVSQKNLKGATPMSSLMIFLTVLLIFLGGGMFLTINNPNPDPNNPGPSITLPSGPQTTGGLFMISGTPLFPTGLDESCAVVTNDIILVLDNSGSMKGIKLLEAKEAAKFFAELIVINPLSKLGLVQFDKTSNLLSPLTSDITPIKGQIDLIPEGSNTCIQCGVLTANEEMKTNGRQLVKKSIVLLSDGKANHVDGKQAGNAKEAAMTEIQKGYQENGSSYYTIAIGEDADTAYMQEIASTTGGVSYASNIEIEGLIAAFGQAAQDICKAN